MAIGQHIADLQAAVRAHARVGDRVAFEQLDQERTGDVQQFGGLLRRQLSPARHNRDRVLCGELPHNRHEQTIDRCRERDRLVVHPNEPHALRLLAFQKPRERRERFTRRRRLICGLFPDNRAHSMYLDRLPILVSCPNTGQDSAAHNRNKRNRLRVTLVTPCPREPLYRTPR